MIYKKLQWLSISWIIFKRNSGAAAAAASFGQLVSGVFFEVPEQK